jgi:excisionase family DNA binding protein
MDSNEQDPDSGENLWDVSELAGFLKVSRSWVYQSVAAGNVPVIRIGAALRFEPGAIRAWMRGERGGKIVKLPGCRS